MVPEGWERRPIKDLCESIIDCVNKTAKHVDFETPYKMIRTTNVRHGRVDTSSVRYVEEETYKQWIRRGAPRDGDIIFTREAPVGEAGILEESEGIFLGQRTMMYRAHPEKSDNRFLLYSLLSGHCQKQIEDLSNGGTVAHMRVPDCGEIFIYSPPLPEQRKIAKILQTWDRAIATTEKLIDASKQQKKALMQQLLTGKKRFAGFEGEWNLKTVAEFGRVVTGSTPPRNFTGHYGGSFSWATAEDFKNKYVANTKTKLTPSGVKTVRIVPKGSVLVTCIASIGKNAIAGEDLATNQQINSVVINNENYNEFFYYVICFNNSKLLSWAGTTAVPILNKSSFEKIPLPAPKIDEQRRVAQVLKSADCELDLLRSRLTHLKQEKKALMQQLLTGKRRVKVNAL